MPVFKITAPDGSVYRVTAPEGATEQEALARVQAQAKPQPENYSPTGSFGENLAAGAGKAVYDLGRGARQALRSVIPDRAANAIGLPTQADIDEARKRDAPLMATGGGVAGNVLGNVAAFVPTAMIPGANTVTGAGVAGAVMGGLQPTAENESRLKNAAIGGATGAAMQYGVGKMADAFAAAKAASAAKAATQESQNAVRDAALKTGQEAGYVVPPRMVQKQGPVASVVEGFGGKIKTEQLASNRNQEVTNTLARKALGIEEDVPITRDILTSIRKKAGEAYEALRGTGTITADKQFASDLSRITQKYEGAAKDFPELAGNEIGDIVKSINKPSFSADSAIDAISILRDKAAAAYAKGDKSLGSAYKQTSQAMEDAIERNLLENAPEAVKAFQAARRLIAKTYTVEKALDTAGNVSAGKIAANLTKGKPLTDELRTIGEFAGSFPKANQSVAKVEPYSVLDTFAGGMLGATAGLPAMAIPLLRPVARSAVLSGPAQRMLTQPSYGPGMVGTVADLLANPALRRTLPAVGTAATLNYGAQ